MRTLVIVVGCLFALASVARADERSLPLPNGGFEQGLEGWTIGEPEAMASRSADRAAAGGHSLRVRDTSPERGSNVRSGRVPVDGAGAFELRGSFYPVSGSGLGVYVRVRDADGDLLRPGDTYVRGLGGGEKRWMPFSMTVYTSDRAAYLEVWIHSWNRARVEGYLDELRFVSLGAEAMQPPWEGQYKIRPDQQERLTPADVVGPDGIVYPNWTRTGVQGGIPDVERFADVEEFGGRADDGADDAAALERACRAAAENGGGAVRLGEGTYHLDRPVTVRGNGVVIRGAGPERTRLIFRYAVPNGCAFYWPEAGGRVGRDTRIELHCRPGGLESMTIAVDGRTVHRWSRGRHSGNTFSTAVRGSEVVEQVPDGRHTLEGTAEYEDGTTRHTSIPIEVDSSFEDNRPVPDSRAAVTFAGPGWAGPKLELARDGERGDTTLHLRSSGGLRAGDCILVVGPATERWKRLTRNECPWGAYRRYEVRVEAVEGNTVRINQPLRIEFPVIDGAYVQKVEPIRRCGIEDLYIEQTENLWISTVVFSHAWNGWARGVTVRKCGRFPVYGRRAKWCEIRDCVFDDAWFKGGGGTAYAGWERSWDCLMENVETFKLRHAPLFQWAASGNVIRKSVFHESDAQWHSGWTNENLMEQCTVTSVRGHGGYGYGMWASPPEDTAHGPNGPRNVVYNCDVESERTGLWMGGMNENWLVLHNRFVVDKGYGVFAKTASFDHIIRDNVFVLRDGSSPLLMLATPDCAGVELIGNRLYGGNGKLADGAGEPARMEGNRTLPLEQHAPRPRPEVPSIYEWQQEHAGQGR